MGNDKIEYEIGKRIADCAGYDVPWDGKPFLTVDMILNGKKVVWSEGVDVWSVLYYSFQHRPEWGGKLYDYSAFYPFSCSCGDAGCAGIWGGIKVRVRKHTVEWRINKDDGYGGFLDKTFYSFDRRQYEKAYKNFIHWMEGHSYDVDDGDTYVSGSWLVQEVVDRWRDKINAENVLGQKSNFGGLFRQTKR